MIQNCLILIFLVINDFIILIILNYFNYFVFINMLFLRINSHLFLH